MNIIIIPRFNLTINDYNFIICSSGTGNSKIIIVDNDGTTEIVNNVNEYLAIANLSRNEFVSYNV